MQFGLLGPLTVVCDGHLLELGGYRQRAVLARLLLDVGRVVSTDRLVDDVWEGHPPATAHKTLQKYVSQLRRVLCLPVVRTSSGGYVLEVEEASLDVRRFERLLSDGDHAAALALWRGDFLACLSGIAFAAPERGRLEDLRLVALEGVISDELALGHHATVAGQLAELVLAHPLRERLTALHMLALYRSGRQVEALRAFGEHRRHLVEDLGIDPAPELRDLETAILRQDPSLDLPADTSGHDHHLTGNLPLPLTSFVGRQAEVGAVDDALSANRLVTLTGPGGVGKTRLALAVGFRLVDRYPGGVWLVDLSGVRSPELVPETVAAVLSIEVRDEHDRAGSLVAGLVHRPPCVVVLDNCEHVVDATALLVARVLGACADVRVLATSRQPIGVDGEHLHPVPPLLLDEAVQLFSERARHLGVPASGAGADQTADICRRLDGLPLAIELAASQLRVLAPDELVARLHHQLRFSGGARTTASRQRTLHDMVSWSYDLLPLAAQRVYARLGVFAGSFTLEAAETLARAAEAGAPDVLDHITTLVDHSLLVREHGLRSGSRYRLLETMRLFALERLAEAEAEDAARQAHAKYFRRLAQDAGRHLYGPDEQAWQSRMELEEPNLQAALAWTAEHDPGLALRLAVALGPYWDSRWGDRRAVACFETLLDGTDDGIPADLRAWGLAVAADLAAHSGDARRGVPWGTEAVARFRQLGDDRGLAVGLVALGIACANGGGLDDADRALAEGVRIARGLGETVVVARALNFASYVAMRRGDHESTTELNCEALGRWTEIGSRRGQAATLSNLAVAAQHRVRLDEADDLCHRALDIWQDLEDRVAVAYVRMTLGDTARLRGELAVAAALYDQARTDMQVVGDRRGTASALKNLATIAAHRGDHELNRDLLRSALLLRHELGDAAGIAECLEAFAHASNDPNREERSVTLLAAAAGLRELTGTPAAAADATTAGELLAAGRVRLGRDSFDATYRRARRLSLDALVEYALAEG